MNCNYLEHGFTQGQKVVCISEDFPLVRKYGGVGKEAERTPQKNEVLVIDEILGEFLRFDKYDTEESFNWWKADRFAPLDEASHTDEIASCNVFLHTFV